MDGSLLVSQSRSLSCNHSVEHEHTTGQKQHALLSPGCYAACTLGNKHIEVSICADSDDAACDDGKKSFGVEGKDGATSRAACMPAVEKQR